MSKSLYDEAIADAQKLRELAEETAKNRVVEAVMPKIRDMVNRRILGEQEFIDEEEVDVEMMSEPISGDDQLAADEDLLSAMLVGEPPQVDVNVDDSAATEESEARRTHVSVSADGDIDIDISTTEEESESEDEVLTDTMAEALGRLIRGEVKVQPTTTERIIALEHRVRKLSTLRSLIEEGRLTKAQKKRLEFSFLHCVREAINLRGKVILTEQDTQDKLERRLTHIIKELRNMSRSNRRNIFDFLFEGEEDEKNEAELAEAELNLELEPEESEELVGLEDEAAVDAALEDVLGGVELSLAQELGEEEEVEDVEVDEEVEDVEDVEVGEEVEMEEGAYMEIDEGMLRREIRRMRRLREQEEGRAAEADPFLDHGGDEVGDVVLDVSEDDLLNALADELGDPDVPEPTVESRRRRMQRRARRPRRSRMAEATARRQTAQYKKAVVGLKRQLVEMNLFNAKLLYANKLMQNKNLTVKQQKAIVEALDNAKTLREAKLLYKSLSESLSRRARGKSLNEGSLRTLGSSSRSTRSAAPAKNGVEADRWAVLAGLPGKN